jgi:hypothetical protein
MVGRHQTHPRRNLCGSGYLMIGASHPVLAASPGSDRNLSRSLSPVVPVVAQSSSATPRRQRFPFSKPVTHLPSRRFPCSTPRDLRQKTYSIPSDWFRLRSMNSIRSAPARPFRRSTPSFRRSTSDRILFITQLQAMPDCWCEGLFSPTIGKRWATHPNTTFVSRPMAGLTMNPDLAA